MSIKSTIITKGLSLFMKGKRKWLLLAAAAVTALFSTMGLGGEVVSDIAQSLLENACSSE